jgi:hypothetical protein
MTDSAHTRRHRLAVVMLCGLLAPLVPSPASAVTGNEWRAMPWASKAAYVSGAVESLLDVGMAVRSLVPAEKRTASEKMLVSFEDCIARTPRPTGQLVTLVAKYLNEHPAQRPAKMSGVVFEALRCKDTTAAPAARKGE